MLRIKREGNFPLDFCTGIDIIDDMRTLRELDDEAMKLAKAKADELCGEDDNYLGITKNEVIAMQANARFAEKYREMYAILQVLDEYLQYGSLDGKVERQPLSKKLKEMLAAL